MATKTEEYYEDWLYDNLSYLTTEFAKYEEDKFKKYCELKFKEEMEQR